MAQYLQKLFENIEIKSNAGITIRALHFKWHFPPTTNPNAPPSLNSNAHLVDVVS